MKMMRAIPALLSTASFGMILYLAYMMDQWVGVMAFTLPYLLFCLVAAAITAGCWIPLLNKRAYVVALVAFSLLAVNLLLPPPSERILRSASLRLVPGTDADTIQQVLKEEYDGSAYSMPSITEEPDRVFVSLLNHEPGNCTALIIHLEEGVVVGCEYSAD